MNGHFVKWFGSDRPVDGGTVHLRQEQEPVRLSTQEEIEAFALELQMSYLGSYPYVSIAEAYWDKFGEDLPDDLGDEIYNLITSGEL